MIKTIHSHQHHLGWSREYPPVIHAAPGETVDIDLLDASGNRISRDDAPSVVETLEVEKANPLSGPVYIDGAQPGDTLVVEIVEFSHSDWGWTALIPGFGLLTEQFPEPWLHISEYDQDIIRFTADIRLPTRPFAGTIGVCPNEEQTLSAIPPHRCGGNMDYAGLVAGSTLYFPVEVEGALFSAGDGHAAQGDGEVCGTAIETSLGIRVKFDLLRNRRIPGPKAVVPGWQESSELLVTTGIGPDLMAAARDAVQFMLDEVVGEYGIDAELAYCLLSCAASLRMAELVNAPNWTVVCTLPRNIFT